MQENETLQIFNVLIWLCTNCGLCMRKRVHSIFAGTQFYALNSGRIMHLSRNQRRGVFANDSNISDWLNRVVHEN